MNYYANSDTDGRSRIGGGPQDKILKFKKGHWQYYDKNKKPLKDHIGAKYMKWVNE